MKRNLLIWTCPECGHHEDMLELESYCCSICGYTPPPKDSASSKKVNHPSNVPEVPYQKQLKELLESIKSWEQLKGYDLGNAAGIFIQTLTKLYLDYFQYHTEEVKAVVIKFSNDLLWAAGVLRKCYVLPELRRFENSDAWDSGWDAVCLTATEIQIFDDMFGDIATKINACEFWDFVEKYRDNPCVYPEKDPPKNIPDHHWWWFTQYDFEDK